MVIDQPGSWHFNFPKYGDEIQISKQQIIASNLIFGTLSLDLAGKMEGKNQTTGDTITIEFIKGSNPVG